MRVAKKLVFIDRKNRKKEFPIMEIQQEDIDAIQNKCKGFVRGTSQDALREVLKTGESNSTYLRMMQQTSAGGTRPAQASVPSRPLSVTGGEVPQIIYRATSGTSGVVRNATMRDRDMDSPNGMGVYFRFVPKENGKNNILNALRGAGGSWPVAFYMELQQALNKQVTTMSSGDFKYGYNTCEKALRMWNDCASICGYSSSQTEIAFYERVLVNDIQSIFVDVKILSADAEIKTLLRSRGFRRVVKEEGGKPVIYTAKEKKWYEYENTNRAPAVVRGASAASIPSGS